MPLTKSKGNMYQWVTHTHAHLGGECSHKCTYCYVNSFRQRVPKYQGKLRLIQNELYVNYGEGKTIFIENCNDVFAEDVPLADIKQIIKHCCKYDNNTYVFQTKNPHRLHLLSGWDMPSSFMVGVTIETNRNIQGISNAPTPNARYLAMLELKCKTFITIEPILEFDLDVFASWIKQINPEFVNIGADSKGHGLQEPTMEKVQQLIDRLNEYGIEIREKSNLERLRKTQ